MVHVKEIMNYLDMLSLNEKSLDDLTQESLNFIFSNINSYPRRSLGYQCPIDVINSIIGKD